MQCFQKDHNLRVSARKLLKHPWIVSARRSDSVVPKKPTEYEEAVKSVQQWNEALRSPDAGSLRRASRPMSSSPVPHKRERPPLLTAPARGPLNPTKQRANPEQFRSPAHTSDDNWDDDFASAISPSALQLPHLRPLDHFGGLLSPEKLKSYASVNAAHDDVKLDNHPEEDPAVTNPVQVNDSDPLQTIRPYHPGRTNTTESQHATPNKPPQRKPPIKVSAPALAAPASNSKQPKAKALAPSRPSMLYSEDPTEDYSDLVLANDGVFDRNLVLQKVGFLIILLYEGKRAKP